MGRVVHGHNKRGQRSPEYTTWCKMRGRCFNQNDQDYKDYGARGITVCQRWRESFAAFLEDMGPRPKGMELDRENNDGNYEPGNCHWVSHERNCNNRRSNLILVLDGRRMNVAEWAREIGIGRKTLIARINRLKWTVRETLTRSVAA